MRRLRGLLYADFRPFLKRRELDAVVAGKGREMVVFSALNWQGNGVGKSVAGFQVQTNSDADSAVANNAICNCASLMPFDLRLS